MRRSAKTVNFGIIYGISAFGLADRLHIAQKEARDLIEGYYQQFPKIITYLNDTIEFARAHGYVETLLHRRRYIRDINAANGMLRKAAERNAINAPIQGTAADLIKIAMIQVDREMTKRQLKSKMLLQIHDELVFEVPQEEIEVMKELVTSIMNNAITMEVPLATDVNYGSSWFDAH
jgi:DNA polymerase-1